MNNEHFSLAYFDFLLQHAYNERTSKSRLQELLNPLYTSDLFEYNYIPSPKKKGSRSTQLKRIKKQSQYQGILSLIKLLGITGNILEIGCGKGALTKLLFNEGYSPLLGVDSNHRLIGNLKKHEWDGLSFEKVDLFESLISGSWNLVMGLHCCGNLVDKVIDQGISSQSSIIAVPCCYGKINQYSPSSRTLQERREEYNQSIKRTSFLEGYVDFRRNTRATVLSELFKRIVDFDRIFYLQELGYETKLINLTENRIKLTNGESHKTTPMKTAIVATK
jgi:hypothetical protein